MASFFWQVFRFDLHFHRRQPLIYIVSLMFFVLAFAGTASENVRIGGGTGNLNLNAPFVVMQTLSVFSIIGMFAVVAFAANPVLRDFEHRTAEMFYTTRVDKFSYLMGRFSAAFLFAYIPMVAASLGVLVGEMMPWLDQQRIADTAWSAFGFTHLCILLPNCFILASLFFCAATLTRSMFGAYLVAVAMIILFSVISSFNDPDTIRQANIADPFGLIAFSTETRYWTVFDRNTRIPSLSGELLINRFVWVAVAIAALVLAYHRFPFAVETRVRRKAKKKVAAVTGTASVQHVEAKPRFDGRGRFAQLISQIALEVRLTLRSVPFIVLLLFAVFNMTGGTINMIGNLFGTPVYPVTGLMMRAIQGSYLMMVMIVIVYYSGELVNRDRALGLAGIIDSAPWPNWVMILAKIVSLFLVIVAMLLVAVVTGMIIQTFHGYYNYQVGLYLAGVVGIAATPFYLAAVLAVTVQSVVQNKYFGMMIMALYMISLISLSGAGFPHQLYRYTVDLGPYSDINGFGHYLEPYAWFTLYWSFFAVLLCVLAHLSWNRGEVQGFRQRLRLARERFSRPVIVTSLLATFAFVATGSFIFYNTNGINDYRTAEDQEQLQADYEKRYKQYEYLPQPVLVDVNVNVDIYPQERDVYAKGRYLMVNSEDHAISDLHVLVPQGITVNNLEIDRATLSSEDGSFTYRIYTFEPALQPGEQVELRFDLAWLNDGFMNHGSSTRVVYNGTFFTNNEMLPLIGYQGSFELGDNNKRRKYALGPVERAPGIDDERALQRAYLGAWQRVHFETIISTSTDQIAMAPGYLERQWSENGRRYFHYKMDDPIWNFFAFLSQDYQVKQAVWTDGEAEVNIEVYYHHEFNTDTMIRSVKDSLDYFTANFSPYQYRQFRILEFPAYASFAQSFPNTIPFSEAIGFIADLRDPEKIDYVYYVTAHELAHQWWAHQVISADTQGAAMIVETLAQYSALMVMEKTFGEAHMQRFLKYELDRYLTGRGGELIEELPLMLVENQGYIHYRKGSVVMYALKEAIGAKAINRALQRLLADYGFKGAPYPTSKTLVAYIRAQAGEEHQALISDLFEHIVLYDLKAEEVGMTELEDGRFQVDLKVSAHKFQALGDGSESEVPLEGVFDIAVLGEEQGESKIPELLHLERVHLTTNEAEFSIIVNARPQKAGIDPWFKQIDRVPTDNVKRI